MYFDRQTDRLLFHLFIYSLFSAVPLTCLLESPVWRSKLYFTNNLVNCVLHFLSLNPAVIDIFNPHSNLNLLSGCIIDIIVSCYLLNATKFDAFATASTKGRW